jgi:catechol 2,3-dioxygenase
MDLKLTKLAHIVLRVRDLERSRRFYRDTLGLKETGEIGGQMAFFSLGDSSHDLAVMALGEGAPPPDPRRVGLYHFAFHVESEASLRDWSRHLREQGVRIVGSADHGVSVGLYIEDPDGNEIELTYDRPRERWPKEGNPFAGTRPLVLD